MKIALACQSVLLEKSLEIFLKKYLTPYKQCDFVISDRKLEINKPLFVISNEDSDLEIPFTSSSLFLKIEKFYRTIHKAHESEEAPAKEIDIEKLENKINKLTDEFRNSLIGVIKDFYEK
jgi:hypothetical protein